MHFIYATGPPRQREFAVTERPQVIPSDAIVCAVCHGKCSLRNLDGELWDEMTDQEFFKLRKMLRLAIAAEVKPNHAAAHPGSMLPLTQVVTSVTA